MRLALLYLTEHRPHAPLVDESLAALTAEVLREAEGLGWNVDLVPCADLPLNESSNRAALADAVVLLGGEDVAPELYGGALEYEGGGDYSLRADAAHISAVHAAVRAGQPMLGICRGLQIINVALGGTLIQHLDTAENHRSGQIDMNSFVRTDLRVHEGSTFAADAPEGPVRCSHHQAIDHLADGLTVTARAAADGVIEAVVHESAPITGVQWHPEHPETAGSQMVGLLRRLERQVRNRASELA